MAKRKLPQDPMYSKIFKEMPDGIFVTDTEQRFIAVNEAACAMVGYTKKELLKMKVADIIPRTYQKPLFASWREYQVSGKFPLIEISLKKKNRRRVSVNVIGTHIEDFPIAIVRDITQRKKAEEQMTILQKGFQSSNDVMFYTNPSSEILEVNPAFTETYGYTREEVIGKTPKIFRSTKSTYELYETMWNNILDPRIGFWRGEIINQAKDGHEVPVILSISTIRDEKGNVIGYFSNAMDITERKKLESQLIHSEKLASVGRLAAGVAHELNTPLANISLITENVLRKDPDDEVKKKLQTTLHQVEIIAKIVKSLLDFSRKTEPRRSKVDVNLLLTDTLELVRDIRKSSIVINRDLSEDIPTAEADPSQLQQVFINMIANAYDAMTNKGKLTIITKLSSDDKIEIHIKDTGHGIPKDDINQIFDPFFTTKRVSQGTGLGLSICHGIITSHGGSITVESEEGEGTEFVIKLPIEEGT